MSNILIFLNISGGEILVILLVVYLVFGPKKIPELARMLGKGINQLRRATEEIRSDINRETSNFKKDMNVDIDLNSTSDINPPPHRKKHEPSQGSQSTNKEQSESSQINKG